MGLELTTDTLRVRRGIHCAILPLDSLVKLYSPITQALELQPSITCYFHWLDCYKQTKNLMPKLQLLQGCALFSIT